MKHIQAVEKFVAQFNKPGLMLVRFPTEEALLSHYPDTFGVVYEDKHFDDALRTLLRGFREKAIADERMHIQNIVHHPEWRELASNEADVVLNTRHIDGQLYLEVVKWRGPAPSLKAIPVSTI